MMADNQKCSKMANQAAGRLDSENMMEEEEQPTEQIVAELLARAANQQNEGKIGGQCCVGEAGGSKLEEQDEQRQKRQFQQWVFEHGNCLYPSREQKERLAKQMGSSYGKVNKLFANHRRRQHKQKVVQQMATANKENRGLTEAEKIDQTIEDIWEKVTRNAEYGHGGGQQRPPTHPPIINNTFDAEKVHAAPPAIPLLPALPQHFTPPAGFEWLQLLAATRHVPPHQSAALPPHPLFNSAALLGQQAQKATGFQQQQPCHLPHQQQCFNAKQHANGTTDDHAPPYPPSTVPSTNLLLATLAHAQQQQMAQQQQQFAIVKAAIEKEIFELLNAAHSQQNMALLAQRHQLLTQLGQLQREQATTTIGIQSASPFHPLPTNIVGPSSIFLSPPLTLSPANSAGNGSCESPSSSASSDSLLAPADNDSLAPLDLDLIEKQIAAQHNRLSAAEAEAVAVLAGLAAAGRVGR